MNTSDEISLHTMAHGVARGHTRSFAAESTRIGQLLMKSIARLHESSEGDGHGDVEVDGIIEDMRMGLARLRQLRTYRDEDGDVEDDNDEAKKQGVVVEKLERGIEEIVQLQAQVRRERAQRAAVEQEQERDRDRDRDQQAEGDDDNVPIQKQFHIEYTPLNAEELERQHMEAVQREAEISKIVHSVGELNSIFHDMDALVGAQGELVDNIEQNIYSTLDHTRGAAGALRKADRWDRRRRRCGCISAVVAVVVLVVLLAIVI
jgi:t-SNARE complex subunit (syntaxin)